MSTDTELENEQDSEKSQKDQKAPTSIKELNNWLDERVDYARQVAKQADTVPVAADELDLRAFLAEALATFSQTDVGQVRAPRLVAGPGLGKSALITDPEFLSSVLDDSGLVEKGDPYRLIVFDGTTTNRATLVEYVPEYSPEGIPSLDGESHYRIRAYINEQLMPTNDNIPTIILLDDASQTQDDRAVALLRTLITKGTLDEHDIAENINLVATIVTDNDNIEHTGHISTIETNRRFVDVRLTIETLARTQAQRLMDEFGMSEENAVAAVVAVIQAHDYARDAGAAGEVIAEHLNWRTLEQGLRTTSLGFDLNQRQVWAKQNRRSQFATAMISLPDGRTINVLADTWSKIQQIAIKDGLAGRHAKEIKETYDKYCRFVGGPPLTRLEEAVFRSIEAHESLAVGTLPGEGKDFAVKSVCEFFGYEQIDLSGPSLTEHSLATSLPDSATGVMRQEFYTRIIDAERSGKKWVLQLDETQSVPPEVLPLYNEVIYKHSLAGTKLENLVAVVSTFNPREMNLGRMREVQENASAPKVTTATRITTHLGPATEAQMVKDIELLFDRPGSSGYSVLAEMAVAAMQQRFGDSYQKVMEDKQVANLFQAQITQILAAIKTWYMGLGKGKYPIDRIGITPGQIDSIVKQAITKLFGSFYSNWRVENGKTAVGWASKPIDLRLGQYRTSTGQSLIPGAALDKLNEILQATLEGLGPKPRFVDILKNPGEVRRIMEGLVPSDSPSETVAELMDYVNLALEDSPEVELAGVRPQLAMLMSAATLHPIVKETCGSILASREVMLGFSEEEQKQKALAELWGRTIKAVPAIALSATAGVNITQNPTTHDEYLAVLSGYGSDEELDEIEVAKQQAALVTYTLLHPLLAPIPWNADMSTDKEAVDEAIDYAVTNWAKALVSNGPELRITHISVPYEDDGKTAGEVQQVKQDITQLVGLVTNDGGSQLVSTSEILSGLYVREPEVDENGVVRDMGSAQLDYQLDTVNYVHSKIGYMCELAERTVTEELAKQRIMRKSTDKDGMGR